MVLALASDVALANRIGIDVDVLRAIRWVESRGVAAAVRFEAGIFNRLTRNAYASHNFGHVRADTDFAMTLAPEAAVRATSWGRWQVLGHHLLDLAGGDPQAAVRFFDTNPVYASGELIVAFMAANPAALAAANAHDFATLGAHYDPGAADWPTEVRNAWMQVANVQRVSADPDAGGASASAASKGGTALAIGLLVVAAKVAGFL